MGDTTLTTFTVNNVAYDNTDEQSITVSPGTTSVPINIVPPAGATYGVLLITPSNSEGDVATIADGNIQNLETGLNTIRVMVEPFGGGVPRLYTFSVTVSGAIGTESSSDTSLVTFFINNVDPLANGFSLPYGTTSVPIFVQTNDSNATVVVTYDVSGASPPSIVTLVDNQATITFAANKILKVIVTAENGSTNTRYNQAIPVADPSSDTSLISFYINAADPLAGGFALPYGTTSVPIFVETNDVNATVVVTYDVSGASPPSIVTLVDNQATITFAANKILKVIVTAENGSTNTRYNQAIPIANPSSDTSLSSFFLNGTDPLANGFSLPYGSTTTEIQVQQNDQNATLVVTYDVSGAATPSPVTFVDYTGTITLVAGHILKVRVTAEDGTTTTLRYNQEIPVAQEGDANTDPYVSTFAGVRYKLPSIDAPIRYFQTMEDGKLLTINAQLKTCSSADLDVSNIRSLLALKNKMTAKQYSVIAQKLMTPETLSFFERVHIQYGDESLTVNLWNSKFEVLHNNLSVKAKVVDRPDLIEKTGIYTGYKASTLKFTFGTTKLFLSVYNSPMIRNGLSIETCAKNCNGVIVNALKQSDMVLPSLDSVIPVAKKDSAKRHVHTETFVDHDGLRTRNIVTYR